VACALSWTLIRAALVAGLVAGVCAIAGSAYAQETSRCRGASEEPPTTQRPAGKQSKLQERVVQFAFGGERGSSDRTVGIDASPSLGPRPVIFAELAGDLERSDGGDSFPVEGIVVQPEPTRSGNVRLRVCLDPDQPENVERGRYVGSIKLTGPQIEPTAITLEATLRLGTPIAVVVLVIGVIVGLVMKALGDKKAVEETTEMLREAAGASADAIPGFTWSD
jgi:hypothetical protein